jgi:hypothetical protein
MNHHAFVRELLIAKEQIVCIHGEDAVNEQPGITVLYNEGTSYFKPVESHEAQREVWEELLALRLNSFTQFDDMLFSPENVACVELLTDENGTPELVISFRNHHYLNDQSFPEEDYDNLPRAFRELVLLLSDRQDARARRAGCFILNKTLH